MRLQSISFLTVLFTISLARRHHQQDEGQDYRMRPGRLQEQDMGFRRGELVGQERFRRQERPNRRLVPVQKVQRRQGIPPVNREQQTYPRQQQKLAQEYPTRQQQPSQEYPTRQQQSSQEYPKRQQPRQNRPLSPFKQQQRKRPAESVAQQQAEIQERSFEAVPSRSSVAERESAPSPDSLSSESVGGPAFRKRPQQYRQAPRAEDRSGSAGSAAYPPPPEQASIEAAVAAGANQYQADEYEEAKRLAFQIHGQEGPDSYRFGYDTGVGYNRQFRYESRNSQGVTHGRYGYYDQEGKLQIVTYSADPVTGFHADGDHVPKPQY